MTGFLSFFVVMIIAVFFSALFGRLHVPWVVTLIVGGMLAGPFGFKLFEPDATVSFLGEVGLVFLMFMAGLETKLSGARRQLPDVAVVTLLNGFLPAAVGVGLGIWLGYSLPAALLVGIIFISTSVAVAVPTLTANGILGTRLGRTIIAATVLEDIISLFLLSWLLQTVAPAARVPLWLLYPFLLLMLISLRRILPKVKGLSEFGRGRKDLFQQELRFVFVLLLGMVVLFEVVGLHPIIAGFLAGLVLSDVLKNPILLGKVRALGYGLFIPIFFVLVGVRTDLSVLAEAWPLVGLLGLVAGASIVSKFLGGFTAGRLRGFTYGESALIGAATIPQLTTTLAVAFLGAEMGLIDDRLLTTLVLLSILTTFIGPLLVRLLVRKIGTTSDELALRA